MTPPRLIIPQAQETSKGGALEGKEQGFSLIELLIVVAIILVIAAIAIPNFLRSRIAANQASAVASCRAISSAEISYAVTFNVGYSSDLASLGPPASGPATVSAAALIDDVLMSGVKSGYDFLYTPGPLVGGEIRNYALNANPATFGRTGTLYFFTDESGVIRQNAAAVASVASSAVE